MEKITKVAVLGTGTMGQGIVQVFAAAGYPVLMCSRETARAQQNKDALGKSLEKLVAKGKMEQAAVDSILNNITPGNYDDCGDCDFVVESIAEDLPLKQKVLTSLEEKCPKGTIFATNTSSLSITEIASAMKDPTKVVGMHFFNPANRMKLVEVVSGELTDPALPDFITKLSEEIGKTPITVKESAGFVVNRILFPMINETIHTYAEGVAKAEDIDQAMQLGANWPMGPLALADLVGLDVCLAILEALYSEWHLEKYWPHPMLRRMVLAGKLGRKSGQGFYDYSK